MKLFAKENIQNDKISIPEIIERPKPHLVIVGQNSIQPYEEIAKKIGFYPPKLLEEQLLRFLILNEIKIFDYEKVYLYLKQKVNQEMKKLLWVWKPLRSKDEKFAWNGDDKEGHGSCYYFGMLYSTYNKLVPLNVLKKVALIEENFLDQVGFFISDALMPDPFIAVKIKGIDRIVFDVWDEPGFE